MKRLIPIFLLVLSVLVLPACNTMAGLGEDVENAGEAIEDEATD
ncbi:MAG: entericidin A/B family lipoprotein [Pseudomonadota bacterium]|nr:entericidin A/B family lipoprotein [Pseudomonadota bacterium]